MASITILSANAGSSSIKFGVFSADDQRDGVEKIAEAQVSGIGQVAAMLHVRDVAKPETTAPLGEIDQAAAVAVLLDWLAVKLAGEPLAGIGHRIVYGGPHNFSSKHITDSLEEQLRALAPFDPEHAPAALDLVAALKQQFAGVVQVACFDTAFFRAMPPVAQMLPLPRKYQEHGLRRYGFHGLSYQYLLLALEKAHGQQVAQGRVIFAHLGSGASLAATNAGQPVDTTMSFTPASGVMMSSRSGDLDPGIAWYLEQEAGVDAETFNNIINHDSGLLGVSGLSADMYTLLQHEGANEHAAEAIDLFCYQIKKAIGALSATIGGLDTLVFSGGIGEQSAAIRTRVCDGLGYLGIELDDHKNAGNAACVSAPDSRAMVCVVPTDENAVIASEVLRVINKG